MEHSIRKITKVKHLFDDATPKVIKSHCFICHSKILTQRKEARGNCCITCDFRCGKVAKGLITEKEADFLLSFQRSKKENEVWNIDGVDYQKTPDDRLIKMEYFPECNTECNQGLNQLETN